MSGQQAIGIWGLHETGTTTNTARPPSHFLGGVEVLAARSPRAEQHDQRAEEHARKADLALEAMALAETAAEEAAEALALGPGARWLAGRVLAGSARIP